MKTKTLIIAAAVINIIALYFIVTMLTATDPAAQEQAIQDALRWRASEIRTCTMAATPAVHTATGAEYTFSDGCLPPGWEDTRNQSGFNIF